MQTTPDRLFEYRDGIYASDLLICAVAHLDFFTLLLAAPRGSDELSSDLKIARRPTDVMLSLFLARGLIRREGPQFVLTDVARRFLVRNSPDSLVPYYASLAKRPQCLEFLEVARTDRPAGWSSTKNGHSWLDSMKDAAFADAFTQAMHSRGAFLASELARRLNCQSYASLLDIGGASGVYACALAERYPKLSATVLEVEPVDQASSRSIATQGMRHRVNVIAGDMFMSLPPGYDIHLFANVFHDWNLDSIGTLVRTSCDALDSGGMIAVFDAHLNEAKDGPLSVAEYSCLVMHATAGRCYSTGEIGDVLTKNGFSGVSVTDVAAERTVITAFKR